MRITVAVVLFAFCLVAQAGITYVGAHNSQNSSTTSRTVTDASLSVQENDFYLLWCSVKNVTAAFDSISGWNLIEDSATTNDTNNNRVALWWRLRGSSNVGNTTCTSGGAANPMKATLVAFRGVDPADPFFVSYSKSDHYGESVNNANAAARPIGSVAPGVGVVLAHFHQFNPPSSLGPPSGYSLLPDPASTANTNRTHAFALKVVDFTGTETPGAWTHADTDSSADPVNITLALRPLASGPSAWIRRRR